MDLIELRPLDSAIVLMYLAAMALFGMYVARKNTSTEAYFVGNRSFPGWAIGLSILGTSISSMTFLSIPADAYDGDWRNLVINLVLPLVAVFAIVYFIPIFRRRRITTAYEYIDLRFGPFVRWFAVLSGVAFQLYRISAVLFLVSIPVSLATATPIWIIIICMGVLIAFYTVLGGIEAVIWTDVVQALVLLSGGLVSFVYIAMHLSGGLDELVAVGQAHDKFNLAVEGFHLGERTITVLFFLGLYSWMQFFATDQTMVQRYVAAESLAAARRATALYASIVVPTWAFFFLIGTSLFVFYNTHPDTTVATLEADQVFPYFIITQLPAGCAGLIVAGLLAAAMSTLDSSINAISTVFTVDVLRPYLAPGKSDTFYLWCARGAGIVVAAIMICGAIFFSEMPKESMNDVNWIVGSLLQGGLVGIFVAALFTRRIDYRAVTIGLIVAFALNVYLALGVRGLMPKAGISEYFIGPLVNVVLVGVAYLVGRLMNWKPRSEQINGMTIWS